MSDIPLTAGLVVYRAISVRDSTRARIDPDSTPTGVVYRNGIATNIPVNVLPLSGPKAFGVSFPVPANAQIGDAWEILMTSFVNGAEIQRWLFIAQTITLGGTVHRGFTTRESTGRGKSADSPPAAIVLRDSAPQAVSVTINPVESPNLGNYMLSFPVNTGWNEGDDLAAIIFASIDGANTAQEQTLGHIAPIDFTVIDVRSLNIVDDDEPIVLQDPDKPILLSDDTGNIVLDDDAPNIQLDDDDRQVGT